MEEVEYWMSDLVISMQDTLKKTLKACLQESTLNIDKYPSSILGLAEEIQFCEKTIQAIKS